MHTNDKIYIAGHSGLVGSAIVRQLEKRGFNNLLTYTHAELDLTNQKDVNDFFNREKPDYVILAAAKVGGIFANNTFPADFIYQNMMIEANIIHSAYQNEVKRLLFLGSTCIYPKEVKQPMKEEYLLTGPLSEETRPYCIAKIAGMELLSSLFRQHKFKSLSIMLPNLYGPNDHYGDDSNHVIPALIQRFVDAKENSKKSVVVWGSGQSIREFLYTDDAADGILFLMEKYDSDIPINLSSTENINIKDLALLIAEIIGYYGDIKFDSSKPEGAPKKISDSSKINSLGWKSKTPIENGLKKTIEDYYIRYYS